MVIRTSEPHQPMICTHQGHISRKRLNPSLNLSAAQRHVHFNDEVEYIPTALREQLTMKEHEACFYSHEDLEHIWDENGFTHCLYNHNLHNNLDWIDDDVHFCIRGLEHNQDDRAHAVKDHLDLVLQAQKKLKEAGLQCETNVWDVSCCSSKCCRLEAAELAKNDAKHAAQYNRPDLNHGILASLHFGSRIQKLSSSPVHSWRGVQVSLSTMCDPHEEESQPVETTI